LVGRVGLGIGTRVASFRPVCGKIEPPQALLGVSHHAPQMTLLPGEQLQLRAGTNTAILVFFLLPLSLICAVVSLTQTDLTGSVLGVRKQIH
jgi:hypothetical protein